MQYDVQMTTCTTDGLTGNTEADPGGGAEGAIAPPPPPPLSLRTRPFLFCTTPPKCLDLRTCENESTRDVRKEVPINDDEIFIAEPQPAPQSGGSNY